MKLFHKVLFWSHLIAGVVAGAVILIMSFTGVILMYERQFMEYAERGQRNVIPPAGGAARMGLDELVAKARAQNSEARPTGVALRNEPTASLVVSFGREGGAVYVDPYTGAVLGRESKLHDWFHDVTDWHRWLGQEGEGRATARAITGACNLAFFWLAITGVYLWWPRSWHWRGLKSSLLFNPRLRGKARDWNWHNVIGFWSSGVLVVLTVTAAVMSYPWANDLLYTLTGSEPPPRAQRAGPGPQGPQARDGALRARKAPASFDAVFGRARQQAPDWVTMTMRLPSRGDGHINVLIQEATAPHVFARSQLQLHRSTAEIIKWEPYAAASAGRKIRMWFRGLHTGEALGIAGQTVAGFASLGGCFLVWTGMAMAWRRFRYRKRGAENAGSIEDPSRPEGARPVEMQTMQPNTIETQEAGKIEMEEATTAPTNGHGLGGSEELRAQWSHAPHNGDSVLILYGTVTGTAEALAKKLAAELGRDGVTTRVRDMAHCQPGVLTQATCVLVIVSTYGDGEPPDDAVHFWKAVVLGNGLDLRGVRYSVLALGNTTYDQFCKCGRDFDAALERHGAIRMYPRTDCDVEYDVPAKHWLDGVRAHLIVEERSALST